MVCPPSPNPDPPPNSDGAERTEALRPQPNPTSEQPRLPFRESGEREAIAHCDPPFVLCHAVRRGEKTPTLQDGNSPKFLNLQEQSFPPSFVELLACLCVVEFLPAEKKVPAPHFAHDQNYR